MRVERIPFAVAPGRTLEAELREPSDLRPHEKLPLLLVFGGFEKAGQVLSLLHTRQRVALASFDYPFAPPRRFEFPACLGYAPELKQMIRETVQGIVALRRALLAARPELDAERVVLVGASLGAPFAVEAAARLPGLGGLVVIHGFGDPVGTARYQLTRALEPRLGRWLGPPVAWLLARLGGWYLQVRGPEAAAPGLRPRLPVLLVSPEHDSQIPREARKVLEDALLASPASVDRRTTPGDHLHPGADALIDQILEEVSRWMRRNGLQALG